MRIALLFYGRIDKYAQCHDSIMNSIRGQGYEYDIFLSSDNPDPQLMTDFIRLYNPVAFDVSLITYSSEYNLTPGRSETNVPNMIRHFINKSRAFQLLKTHVEYTKNAYDVVFSLRLDLSIDSPFMLANDSVQQNTIYIPDGCDYVENAINDQIAYGTMESMEKYMNVFHNMLHLIQSGKSIVHPETLTLSNIRHYEMDIVRFPLSYYIER